MFRGLSKLMICGHWVLMVTEDATRLTSLSARLAELDRGDLLDTVRIGLQSDLQVTFARRFAEPHRPTRVSQAFCSAVSCAYSRSVDTDDWAPFDNPTSSGPRLNGYVSSTSVMAPLSLRRLQSTL